MINIEQIRQSINKLRTQFSMQFFLAGIVLTVAFFLVFISSFKTYTASITILINAKSEIAVSQEKQMIGNMLEFPRLLSFYDRLLKYNPDVRDVAENKSPSQRKDFWNDMLSVKKVGRDSSLIKISITTQQKNDAEQLVQKTARTLFDTAGLYYNIKNDVDLRIVDGSISKRNIFQYWWMLPLSLVVGFLVTIFLQKMIARSIDIFTKKESFLKNKNLFDFNTPTDKKNPTSPEAEIESLKELYTPDQVETAYPIQQKPAVSQFQDKRTLVTAEKEIESPKEFYPNDQAEKIFPIEQKPTSAQFQEMKKLTKMTEQDKYPNFREIPKHAQQKASAPDNLPIADNSFFMQKGLNIQEQPQQEQLTSLEPEIKKHEPTDKELKARMSKLLNPEIKQKELAANELKERLNKLLRGEL